MNILSTGESGEGWTHPCTTAPDSMVPPAPNPSVRLIRAASAERQELARHRERLLAARDELREQLARVDLSLAQIDERQTLLDRLAGTAMSDAATAQAEAQTPTPASALLRGPAIRRTAVEVLLADPRQPEALHYRDWFERLLEAGFQVAGKDPLAVFLTQLSRSPVIRRSTEAGVYELDRAAPHRLRTTLDQLHADLRKLTVQAGDAADLGVIRARRAQLTAEIGHVEKALEEAEAVLTSARAQRAAAS